MLDLRFVSDHIEKVRAQLARRGLSEGEGLDELVRLAKLRKRLISEVETLRAKRNEASQEMAKLDKSSSEFTEKRDGLRSLSDRVKQLEDRHRINEDKLSDLLLRVPNLPHASAPDGFGESDNVEILVSGEKPLFEFKLRDHVDLGTALGILDVEAAAKISGSRFVVLRRAGARLSRALLQFMLDVHADQHGYEEVWPPVLIKDTALEGTGQLPKFARDVFRIAREESSEGEDEAARHDLYLAPTAEVPVTNLLSGEILEASGLPVALTAYTACFRSEAGSYGKDTRGMIRVHQFDKVELVRFCTPEEAEAELEKLTGHAETILKRLGLHYRKVQLCAGDMGFAATKAYDLEVWLPGQQAYREISSCSWFGDFQARRANIRYRPEPKAKPRFVHTLNGSGLAIGRTLVAILEQFQEADGSVRIPKCLVPYMGGLEVIRAQ